MSHVGGSLAWRLPIACQMIFAFVRLPSLLNCSSLTLLQVVIGLVFGLPESPRYLYKENRNDEALGVLCDVYDRQPDDPKIVKEANEILDALALERQEGEYSWSQILHRDSVQTGKRVLLAYGMQFMNQVGGINLVV